MKTFKEVYRKLLENHNENLETIKNLATEVFGNANITGFNRLTVNAFGKTLTIEPRDNSAHLTFTDDKSSDMEYMNPRLTADSMGFMRKLKYFGQELQNMGIKVTYQLVNQGSKRGELYKKWWGEPTFDTASGH